MESKRILVTGGAGFMGSWICKSLVEKGHNDIYCIDDLSGGSLENIQELTNKKEIEFIKLDLSSKDTNNIIKNIEPEIIYYLAANAREGASFFQPLEIAKRNYFAYINLLEPAIKVGKLDKVILFSSMATYGLQTPPFDEKMRRKPVDIYGISKSAMEKSTELLSEVHDFRYTILRPHNVFGEFQSLRDKYRNVFGIWMNKIMSNETLNIYGDGNQIRAFSYIKNSLDCYINAMNNESDGEIINIGGMKPITINEALQLVCEAMGVYNHPVQHLQDRFGEVKMAYCTWKKSEDILGYDEKISLEDGIKYMAEWALNKGKQEWTEEKLELWNSKAPECWR